MNIKDLFNTPMNPSGEMSASMQSEASPHTSSTQLKKQPREGLVPKTGNWEHPGRWVRPTQIGGHNTDRKTIASIKKDGLKSNVQNEWTKAFDALLDRKPSVYSYPLDTIYGHEKDDREIPLPTNQVYVIYSPQIAAKSYSHGLSYHEAFVHLVDPFDQFTHKETAPIEDLLSKEEKDDFNSKKRTVNQWEEHSEYAPELVTEDNVPLENLIFVEDLSKHLPDVTGETNPLFTVKMIREAIEKEAQGRMASNLVKQDLEIGVYIPGDRERRLEEMKGSSTVGLEKQPRPGLVPQTGNWERPGRWVLPDGQSNTNEMTEKEQNWIHDNIENDWDIAVEGESPNRVVWGVKAGDTLETYSLDSVGYHDGPENLRGIHVGDPDFWKEQLEQDYGMNPDDAKTIKIRTDEGDAHLTDNQYAIPPEDGSEMGDAFVLVTKRQQLEYGKDWVFEGENFYADTTTIQDKDLWEMTQEEFIANPPKGFKFQSGTEYGSDAVLANRHIAEGETVVHESFFRLSPADRRGLLAHEEGHDLMYPIFGKEGVRSDGLLGPFKIGDRPLDIHTQFALSPFDEIGENPEELIANVYQSLVVEIEGMSEDQIAEFHRLAPLAAKEWAEKQERIPKGKGVYRQDLFDDKGDRVPEIDALFHAVAKAALRQGKFVPEEVLSLYPDLSEDRTQQTQPLEVDRSKLHKAPATKVQTWARDHFGDKVSYTDEVLQRHGKDLDVPEISLYVSPVFNMQGRNAVVVELEDGTRQGFYQRTGTGGPGSASEKESWVPFDGIKLADGWIDKYRFTAGNKNPLLDRYGTKENYGIGKYLDSLDLSNVEVDIPQPDKPGKFSGSDNDVAHARAVNRLLEKSKQTEGENLSVNAVSLSKQPGLVPTVIPPEWRVNPISDAAREMLSAEPEDKVYASKDGIFHTGKDEQDLADQIQAAADVWTPDTLEKQARRGYHEHDAYPFHPVRVGDHPKYFTANTAPAAKRAVKEEIARNKARQDQIDTREKDAADTQVLNNSQVFDLTKNIFKWKKGIEYISHGRQVVNQALSPNVWLNSQAPIPAHHLTKIRKIKFTNEDGGRIDDGEIQGEIFMQAWGRGGEIEIFNADKNLRKTLTSSMDPEFMNSHKRREQVKFMKAFVHEVGHLVYYTGTPMWFMAHVKRHFQEATRTGEGFPSVYSKRNEMEFFAECYVAFVTDTDRLTKRNPGMAKFLTETFKRKRLRNRDMTHEEREWFLGRKMEPLPPEMQAAAEALAAKYKRERNMKKQIEDDTLHRDPEGIGQFDPDLPDVQVDKHEELGCPEGKHRHAGRDYCHDENSLHPGIGMITKHTGRPDPFRV